MVSTVKRPATYYGFIRFFALDFFESLCRALSRAFPEIAPAGPCADDLLSYNRKEPKKKKRSSQGEDVNRREKKDSKTKAPAPDGGDYEEDKAGDPEDSSDSGETESIGEWGGSFGGEDLELIERFLNGNKESFNRLVIKYQNKVYNLSYRFLGDADEAEDMAQEVFMTVHKSLKKFRGDSLFSTWLFRITVNHCKNRLKFLGRRRYYQSVSIDQPQETEEGDLYHEVEDESPDPESSLSSQETQKLVQDAISRLDPEHRLVIVLRDIEDMAYEEIAEMLGIKVGTVKSRIHRGRSELKSMLDKKLGFLS